MHGPAALCTRFEMRDFLMSVTVDAVAGKATRREWIGLLILSIACLIYSMDLSVLFLAMPAIVADLDPSATQLLWINDI